MSDLCIFRVFTLKTEGEQLDMGHGEATVPSERECCCYSGGSTSDFFKSGYVKVVGHITFGIGILLGYWNWNTIGI
jgi:hypothetical protein